MEALNKLRVREQRISNNITSNRASGQIIINAGSDNTGGNSNRATNGLIDNGTGTAIGAVLPI